MKLNEDIKVPSTYNRQSFVDIIRSITSAVNMALEFRQVAFYQAQSSVPTTGSYALGDFVLNSAPSELGVGGSKYIIHGWRCTAAGTPGTFVQCRFLTGN